MKMKKIILLTCVLIVSAFALFAQSPASNSVAGTQDSIVFNKKVHDYGTIVQGSNGNSEFKFINKGKLPLVLSNVQASCGCTVPEWPKEPVLPGKSAVVKVTYNTNNVGTFGKTITVTSNAVNSSVVLQIKGTVTAKP